jgi:hypothetical protein
MITTPPAEEYEDYDYDDDDDEYYDEWLGASFKAISMVSILGSSIAMMQ